MEDNKRFKIVNDAETRSEVAANIREQYPDRYPVIVEKDPNARMFLHIEKKKYLAPGNITLSKFMKKVREHIEIQPQDPLAVMVESGGMVSGNSKMSDIYEDFKDEDGFLYILVSSDV
jgi:hypothetical protein